MLTVPSQPHRRLPRVLVAILCVGMLGAVLSPSPASAQDDVQSLRDRASALADRLQELEREAAIADEDYLGTLDELEKLYTEINSTEVSIEEAQGRVESAEAQASEFLVAKYMDAGSADTLAAVSTDDVNSSMNQQVMLSSLRGDREQLTDELAASRADLQDRKDELAQKQADVESVKADQEAAKARLESSVAESEALYNEANGELQSAIQAEQRRREAEAAERAAAEAAQREAEQAAAAAAQPRTSAATAPTSAAPSGSGSSSATAPSAPSSSGGGSSSPAPVLTPTPPPAPPTSSGAAGAIQAAKTQIGKMYRYGGSSPSTGFDCSGLMMWSWSQVGVGLPRTSGSQYASTQRISQSQLQPGDLVFYGSPVYHVGMYVGGGAMIDSPRTGKAVSIRSIYSVGSPSGFGRVR